MIGRIVVGIDGSQESGYALEWAVDRTRLGGEELELVAAYTLTPELDFYGYHGLANPMVDWIIEGSEQVLDAAATRVRELAPDLTCTVNSKLGHPAHVLAAASESANALVVGRRGLGRAMSVLLGSVSNSLTVQAKCPLVVVGEAKVPAGPIVVGVDGSEFGTNALRYAIAEATLRNTSVRAVAAYEVLHQGFSVDPELAARLRADVQTSAAATVRSVLDEAQRTDAETVSVDHIAVEGRAAEAILDHADDAQLIVVGTHGKGLIRRVLLGSVSRQVLHDAERPVAVVDRPDS